MGLVTAVLLVGTTAGDEAPIAGTVKAVDGTAGTLTVEVTVEVARQGQPRAVLIEIRPTSRIVRFARSTESGTRHDGDREVAEVVRIVFER